MITRSIWFLTLVGLFAGSWWLLGQLESDQDEQLSSERHVPYIYMNAFSTRVMGASGRVVRELEARTMVHYADTETSEFSDPHVIMYREDGPPWHIKSETGWVSADGDTMRFNGEVLIWREEGPGEHAVDVTTSDLEVRHELEYGETANAVRIETRDTDTRGVGMRAYLGQGRIELLSDVRTLYSKPTP